MSNDRPLIYVVLGATGSGRREVLADLIESGLHGETGAKVLLAVGEATAAADARLPLGGRWSVVEGQVEVPALEGTGPFFLVSDGRGNPVDQLEALKPWLTTHDLELGRIICVINCRLAEAHPALLAWYDACVHFSDVVLLANRDGVANKWLSDLQARYRDQFMPALFEMVRQGRVKNPALVLEPQPRRLSHYFDEDEDWLIDGLAEEDDADIEEGNTEVEVTKVEDPFFQRRIGGRREKEIPDVAEYLDLPADGT